MVKKLSFLFFILLFSCGVSQKTKEKISFKVEEPKFKISEVSFYPKIFNPSEGEVVNISYKLSKPAKSILRIYDLNMDLIKEIVSKDFKKTKVNLIWDGKDREGRIVPDKVYFFKIQACDSEGNITCYDPSANLKLKKYSIKNIEFDEVSKVIRYFLKKDALVKLKIGIPCGGPLLRTILNWEPRLAGENEEFWDEMDDSKNIKITEYSNFKIIAEAATLPENTIFTYGNKKYTYFEYKQFKSESSLKNLEFTSPKIKFYLEFPKNLKKTSQGIPILEGKVPIKIYLDKKIKKYVIEQRFEIMCFLDFKFIHEIEGEYSPYTWIFDTSKISEGDHILTVNIVTLKGDIGSFSKRIRVCRLE